MVSAGPALRSCPSSPWSSTPFVVEVLLLPSPLPVDAGCLAFAAPLAGAALGRAGGVRVVLGGVVVGLAGLLNGRHVTAVDQGDVAEGRGVGGLARECPARATRRCTARGAPGRWRPGRHRRWRLVVLVHRPGRRRRRRCDRPRQQPRHRRCRRCRRRCRPRPTVTVLEGGGRGHAHRGLLAGRARLGGVLRRPRLRRRHRAKRIAAPDRARPTRDRDIGGLLVQGWRASWSRRRRGVRAAERTHRRAGSQVTFSMLRPRSGIPRRSTPAG